VKDARQHCLHQNVTTNLLKKLHQGKELEAMASTQSEKVNVYKPAGQFSTKKESFSKQRQYQMSLQQMSKTTTRILVFDTTILVLCGVLER
jgi:hypothetical protein